MCNVATDKNSSLQAVYASQIFGNRFRDRFRGKRCNVRNAILSGTRTIPYKPRAGTSETEAEAIRQISLAT